MSRKQEVYMIESRSPEDFWADRHEGRALSKMLELALVGHKYREVVDEEHLHRALKEADAPHVKYVHISAHGEEDGIKLTCGTLVEWERFIEIGGRHLEGKCLVFSSCCVGRRATQIFNKRKAFCLAVVAPLDVITWPEGLAAYAAFYHLACDRDRRVQDDVLLMNKLVGRKTFRVVFSSPNGQTHALGS